MELIDIIALVINIVLFVGYNIFFFYKSFYLRSSDTLTGWTSKVRARWVQETSLKKGGDILAIQTLRNWILAATFLATVAITISFGLLAFLAQAARSSGLPDLSADSLVHKILTDPLAGLKTILIISGNFTAFFVWMYQLN